MTRFGRPMLGQWLLDPAVTYLNHGTVGATPRRVLAAQQAIRDEIERQPSRYLLRELTGVHWGGPRHDRPRLRAAADTVAAFVGASGDDLVFVDNTTTGANAVLRSLPLAAGEEILMTDLAYGGVVNAARYAARERGVALRTVEMPDPGLGPGAFVAAIDAALGERTRLLVVDHVTANSALLLPVAAIAARCRAKGVLVLVDGAHAPGAIALDVPALGADWYVGNLHKWAWAPRSSGILWAARERQAGLHPPVISWGLDLGLAAEFAMPGTRDPSPHLAAPAALDFMRELGVEAVREHNHGLAWRGARRLAVLWDVPFAVPEPMIGTMATVPLPEVLGATRDEAELLRDALLFADGIEVHLFAWRGRLWTRISCQVYNDLEDVERLGAAVLARQAGAARRTVMA
ncbi:MAG TPA: aminotransferase class V-fold PLP-dependent enzyme [Thermoanaerobaculia bacterium]|nr:aminotransferase class V-fold PLP-dependent enzyme [Thermoanaerobaculia bacterium]